MKPKDLGDIIDFLLRDANRCLSCVSLRRPSLSAGVVRLRGGVPSVPSVPIKQTQKPLEEDHQPVEVAQALERYDGG